MKKGDQIAVTTARLDETGAGVADTEGVEVHVDGLVPPESAVVHITARSRHHPRAFGRIESRTGPSSPARQAAACPAFGRCGGCRWQHVAYPQQLREKRARVARALGALLAGTEVAEPIAAPAELGYRNKGIYRVARFAGGVYYLGANAPGSDKVIDTSRCRVVRPVIDAVARDIATALNREVLAGDVLQLRYVVLRSGLNDQVLVGLVCRSPEPDLAPLVERLAARPEVHSVVSTVNDRNSDAVLAGEPVRILAGPGTVPVALGELFVDAGLESFVQVNGEQAARMCAIATDWAKEMGATSAADLYCGLGGFALHLARAGIEVTAVERSADLDRAAQAAERHRLSRATFVRQDADTSALGPLDLVVVNPPRKGLSAKALDNVLAASPGHVIYVSCSPDSLARDLGVLTERGYRIERVQPVDLMPGTSHIETMVLLSRSSSG